ncbi:MAG: exodeoxyribonuclease V subunit gamma [Sedimentisphaerales bacterium]|nr:exodeoxyribonuclease V subunit gamma [Sedimentisphaerales bacterium]
MAVQFILGRSGTGKTHYCIQAVVDALLEPGEKPLILLVPEQATYQVERAILADDRIAGYNRLHVLSFDRLQFLLLGKNTARPTLSRIGRQMIVQRILRENADQLKLFGATVSHPGLSRQMARTIAELHEYAKTPDDVNQLVTDLVKDERSPLAVLKFSDIGLIFQEYLKFIEDDFLDPDAQLIRACRAVSTSDLIKGARLWIDGFAGFTMAELMFLVELLKTADDVHIALCLDPLNIDLANPRIETLDTAGLFYPTERTYSTLFEVAKKSKLQLTQPVILEERLRFSRCRQLAHIERAIFTLDASRMPAADNIRVISAPDERSEVRFVVRQMLQLVKDKGFRYRDIAVIASDLSRYEHYIRAYFDDYNVPFFIDKRRPLSHHPVVQLVNSALRVVTGGFSHGDLFGYLKTDLVPVDRHDVDLLENYCLAYGLSAGDWQTDKEWHFTHGENEKFDERQINRIRMEVNRPLLRLRDRLCPADGSETGLSADQFTRVIFDFLDDLYVRRTLGQWIKDAVERNDRATADEHQQFYSKFVDVFDELVDVFTGHTMTVEDFLAILNSAFSQMTLALIPPTLDQVLIGSIERSRHPDLKAVFLIGATQKQFPTPFVQDSLLTDDDRIAAESADFLLAPGVSQSLAERQYLAYIAFTRPSEFLYVSYPSVDEKGSAIPRSQFVGDLESLFDDLEEESVADQSIQIEQVYNETELTDMLCSRLGRDNPVLDTDESWELLSELGSDEQLRALGEDILSALHYDNKAELDTEVVQELFGRRVHSSATRLSTYAACPYQHFARYVLELKEREEFKFEPLDLGSFYHRILDALVKRINTENKDFHTIDNGELLVLLREEIERVVKEDSFISNFIGRRGYNEFIIHSAGEILEECVLAVAQMVRAGSFRPKLSEVAFGRAKEACENLGVCEFVLGDNRVLSLDGKIDRLDVARLDGLDIAIVFDYKRRDTPFGWSQFYHGLDMQLPIYMLAARHAKDTKIDEIVGAFYMPIEVSPKKVAFSEMLKETDRFNRKAKGIFNGNFFRQLDRSDSNTFYNFFVTQKGDQYGFDNRSGALRPDVFEIVLEFAEDKIIQLAGEMTSGKINVEPYRLNNVSPCSYCKYKAVCRFDWQINDYRLLESLNKSQALERIGGENG